MDQECPRSAEGAAADAWFKFIPKGIKLSAQYAERGPFMRRALITAVFASLVGSGQALAQAEGVVEVPRGLWETQADKKGVIFHVRTKRCGRALCGRVLRAKDRRGYDTPSDAVGNKVLWSLVPQPDGSFLGEYRDSSANIYDRSRVTVVGRELRLNACDAQGCQQTIWYRIR